MAPDGQSMREGTQRVRDAKKLGDIEELCAIATDPGQRGPWRKAAVKALRKHGDGRTVKVLGPLLRDPDRTLRGATLKTILKLGGANLPKTLVEGLDSDVRTASKSADALGKLRAKEGIRPLIERVAHPEWRLRRSAARALSKIGDPAGLETIAAQAERETGTQKRVMKRFAKPSEKR